MLYLVVFVHVKAEDIIKRSEGILEYLSFKNVSTSINSSTFSTIFPVGRQKLA